MISKYQAITLTIRVLVAFIALAFYLFWQNNSIMVTQTTVNNAKIPASFNGYRIVHLSDLHNKRFGAAQSGLLSKIKEANPDIIVVTGDLIDRRRTNIGIAMEFINGAVAIAPVYYVPGNHEAWSGVYPELAALLENAGAIVLDNRKTTLAKEGEFITLYGAMDRKFRHAETAEESIAMFEETLRALVDPGDTNYRILLSHRPELLDIYADKGMDLVFSGHAHGGQIRLPVIGAILVPDQEFPPKYTDGVYEKEQTTMVVSRGLGSSIIPIRTFNRPEVVVVTLKTR